MTGSLATSSRVALATVAPEGQQQLPVSVHMAPPAPGEAVPCAPSTSPARRGSVGDPGKGQPETTPTETKRRLHTSYSMPAGDSTSHLYHLYGGAVAPATALRASMLYDPLGPSAPPGSGGVTVGVPRGEEGASAGVLSAHFRGTPYQRPDRVEGPGQRAPTPPLASPDPRLQPRPALASRPAFYADASAIFSRGRGELGPSARLDDPACWRWGMGDGSDLGELGLTPSQDATRAVTGADGTHDNGSGRRATAAPDNVWSPLRAVLEDPPASYLQGDVPRLEYHEGHPDELRGGGAGDTYADWLVYHYYREDAPLPTAPPPPKDHGSSWLRRLLHNLTQRRRSFSVRRR